jgi:hypothetical protein
MAEVCRRGTKKYLGIDFDPNDYEQLRQIAAEDGDRGVSSLVRAIVRSWLRTRNAGQALPTIMTIPQPPPARPSIVLAPSELVAAEEYAPEASDKSGDDN